MRVGIAVVGGDGGGEGRNRDGRHVWRIGRCAAGRDCGGRDWRSQAVVLTALYIRKG